MEYALDARLFKQCSVALRAAHEKGQTEQGESSIIEKTHRTLMRILHDFSSTRPSKVISRLIGRARRSLQDIFPKRDFSIREAIIAEVASVCETLASVKFGRKLEEISAQGMQRMSEAHLFCRHFAAELGTPMRPPRTRRTRRRREKRR